MPLWSMSTPMALTLSRLTSGAAQSVADHWKYLSVEDEYVVDFSLTERSNMGEEVFLTW